MKALLLPVLTGYALISAGAADFMNAEETHVKPAYAGRTGQGRRDLIRRYEGSRATEMSVDLALQWLAYHQEADGHWDTMKYGADNKSDTAITALSALAYLGAGHTERVGFYKANVQRAVAWLISKQNKDGLIFDDTDEKGHRAGGYPAAMATLALCEAAGVFEDPSVVQAAQKAVRYAEFHRQQDVDGKGGWRYLPNSPGDISVSSWFIAALKSAKIAGLKVDHTTFDGAVAFLDSVELKPRGVFQFTYMPGKETNKRRTMMGVYGRITLGYKASDYGSAVQKVVDDQGVPIWGSDGENVDFYYWYYGTLACFQIGGDVWKRWNVGLKKSLTENQCQLGDDAGSWPIAGNFSNEWGRAGQTAFGALCLEVYYRYPRLDPTDEK
jgi:hypothetical protein